MGLFLKLNRAVLRSVELVSLHYAEMMACHTNSWRSRDNTVPKFQGRQSSDRSDHTTNSTTTAKLVKTFQNIDNSLYH